MTEFAIFQQSCNMPDRFFFAFFHKLRAVAFH